MEINPLTKKNWNDYTERWCGYTLAHTLVRSFPKARGLILCDSLSVQLAVKTTRLKTDKSQTSAIKRSKSLHSDTSISLSSSNFVGRFHFYCSAEHAWRTRIRKVARFVPHTKDSERVEDNSVWFGSSDMYVPFCFVRLKATASENKENLLIGHCSKVGGRKSGDFSILIQNVSGSYKAHNLPVVN